MFGVAHNYFDDKSENFEELLDDAKKPLYSNCKKFTKMYTLVKLYKLNLDGVIRVSLSCYN